MKYTLLFVLLAFLACPGFTQDWRGALTNKNLKGKVKTVTSRYVSYRDNADGSPALMQTYRYNERGLLVERSFDFPGEAAHMSMKWISTYDPSGQRIKHQVFHTRDMEGNERLLPGAPDFYRYNADGKEIECLTVNSKGDTTMRMFKEYDDAGFLVRYITDGYGHSETVYKNDERGNAVETITGGSKCSYIYDSDNRVIEQRWHDGLTDRVYQRQTSKYEDGRLVEKITYSGEIPETACIINYENFDAAGNYTKETWYDHGKLTMTHEYAFTYQ